MKYKFSLFINNDIILKESSISKIEKNFPGIQFDNKEKTSIISFIDICRKICPEFKYQKDYNILERIKENLTDIYNYSERNKINYSDYNSSLYNFDTIEELLGKIILPGKFLFENGKELNSNTYKSEYFREIRTQLFIEYMLKYVQEPLDNLEKENIIKYIIEEFPDNYDFKNFFNSIQMLIFYLAEKEKEIIIDDLYISDIFEKTPSNLKLSEDCKYFFLNKKYKLNELKINKLLKINNFLEQFYYKDLIRNLNYKYKIKISKEKQKEIEVKLKDIIYIQKDLAAAVRRFITRYLTEAEDINENEDLADEIYRVDLWDEEMLKKGNLNSILDKLREIKLKVEEASDFYELINQEDKKIIEEYEKIRINLKKENKIKDQKEEKEEEEKVQIKELLKDKKEKTDEEESIKKIKENKGEKTKEIKSGEVTQNIIKEKEIEFKKIKILFNMIIQECHYLKEIISETDNTFISVNDFLDMEKSAELFNGLENFDNLKLKENITTTEYENILVNFNKFISNYNRVKTLQSSLFESFIKRAKDFAEDTSSLLLKEQYNEEKDKNSKTNNFTNNLNEFLYLKNNDLSSRILLEEKKGFFSIMNNFTKGNNNNNSMNNKVILEKKIEELNENINKLKLDLEREKTINNNLSLNIEKLETMIKDKEKEIKEEKSQNNELIKKINDIKNISSSNKILELFDRIEEKDNEIKELKQILPFEYSKGEKVFIVTFLSLNEDIHYSMICKNTDNFYRLEITFYNKFPEFKDENNIFFINGKIINKLNNLESNNINDNDIIIFKTVNK